MSAYAALRDSLLNQYNGNGGQEDELILYSQNSSDEEGIEEDEQKEYELKNGPYDDVKADVEIQPMRTSNTLFNDSDPNPISVTESNFFPSKNNFIADGTSVQVGLRGREHIVIHGQCIMSVLKGTALINNHLLVRDRFKKFTIIAPQSQALPIIAAADGTRDNSVTSQDDQNDSLCEREFSTIVLLESFSSGLENIGSYFAAFREYLCPTSQDTNSNLKKRTFEIITKELTGTPGLSLDSSWSQAISNILSSVQRASHPQIFLIIGNKNTGKSTFTKSLLNSMILDLKVPVAFLDLDPGQSEFSAPLSLSLTEVSDANLGLNVPSSSQLSEHNKLIAHFFGFTSPIYQPDHYLDIAKRLFQIYQQKNKKKTHLIINTPGWIKGYGKEILISLTDEIRPDHLVLLSSTSEYDRGENPDILKGLKYEMLSIVRSINNESTYTAAQLREFNKLAYFHQKEVLKFDFERHILHSSPFKVSYQATSSLPSFKGINAITCLNYDVGYNFELEDMLMMIDASLVGLYLLGNDEFEPFRLRTKKSQLSNLPLYLNHTDYKELAGGPGSNELFAGLALVHSINSDDKYMNLYLPTENANNIKKMVERGYCLLLIKGDGEMPSSEMLNPLILKEHERQVRRFNLQKRSLESDQDVHVGKLPYISFESKRKVGGVWRVRHNIMRRSHR